MSSLKHDSISIDRFYAMSVLGIQPLTGEACALSMRMLCDVNAEGRQLLSDYFGIPNLEMAPPMNSRVDEQPSVGSIMLPRQSWPEIARFGLFMKGALALYERDTAETTVYRGCCQIVGIFSEERVQEYVKAGLELAYNPLKPHVGENVRVGSRNVHQMTGRVI